ncbi:zinc finger CCCH domain-containing protein 22 [Dorcoceras hygrometricum]|uniref:Zinc finger CCCH domain-containing protein 22 n=1 Tax=Dorcoceras hygrometricum TaxID=472368 RepID=A0A2Z7CNN8_9LAMI|nr:zinc finger CCCH domain-containing protein 22 [Dorcoceras hygrometricum]
MNMDSKSMLSVSIEEVEDESWFRRKCLDEEETNQISVGQPDVNGQLRSQQFIKGICSIPDLRYKREKSELKEQKSSERTYERFRSEIDQQRVFQLTAQQEQLREEEGNNSEQNKDERISLEQEQLRESFVVYQLREDQLKGGQLRVMKVNLSTTLYSILVAMLATLEKQSQGYDVQITWILESLQNTMTVLDLLAIKKEIGEAEEGAKKKKIAGDMGNQRKPAIKRKAIVVSSELDRTDSDQETLKKTKLLSPLAQLSLSLVQPSSPPLHNSTSIGTSVEILQIASQAAARAEATAEEEMQFEKLELSYLIIFPCKFKLMKVHLELVQAIKDAEEGLFQLKRAKLLREADYALRGSLYDGDVNVEPIPTGVESESSADHSYSIGSKCRFRHTNGRWYDGLVVGLEGPEHAKIAFLTPTSESMLVGLVAILSSQFCPLSFPMA